MRALAFLVLSLFPAFSFAAKPMNEAELRREIWRRHLSHLEAYQPRVVGGEAFLSSFGLKPYMAPGKELFRATSKSPAKDWPALKVEGDSLKIVSDEGSVVLVEQSRAGEILVNGRAVKLDAKKPLLPQAKKWIGQDNAAGWSLFAEAYAIDVTSGLMGGVGTAVAATVLAAAGAPAVAVGAGVAGVGCSLAVGLGFVPNGTVWEKYRGCVTWVAKPLGEDPNDQMKLVDLFCDVPNRTITAFVASPSGTREQRTFTYGKFNDLERVVLRTDKSVFELKTAEGGQRFKAGKTPEKKELFRPKHDKELDAAQGLLADYDYFTGLCLDEARLKKVKAEAAVNMHRPNVSGDVSPEGLSDSAE